MARRVHIPGLVDILWLHGPEEIAAAAAHPALDRSGAVKGPLVNRWIRGNLSDALRTPEAPLPSAQPQGDAARIAAQEALRERLADPALWDDAAVDALAAWIGGDRSRHLGPLAQEAIGRLFTPGYRANHATWRAAEVMIDASRSLNPIKRALWAATGAVGKAQRVLSDAVGGDPAGVHATGVAVHSLKTSVEALAAAMSDRNARRRQSARGAVGAALRAPPLVLRAAARHVEVAGVSLTPGALVLFPLDAAAQKTLNRNIAFMSRSWAACPADRAVPHLMAELWRRSTGERAPDLLEDPQ